jgi:TM2 domain-containing membrane protein YozV
MNYIDPKEQQMIDVYTKSLGLEQKRDFLIEYYGNRKNYWINLALILSVGGLGIHKFYLQNKMGFWYLGLVLWIVLMYIVMIVSMLTRFAGSFYLYDSGFDSLRGMSSMMGIGLIFTFLLALPALALAILIIYDICTFKQSVNEYNLELAKGIVAKLNNPLE